VEEIVAGLLAEVIDAQDRAEDALRDLGNVIAVLVPRIRDELELALPRLEPA
jgi:microcompartment protein CcmL/EutN